MSALRSGGADDERGYSRLVAVKVHGVAHLADPGPGDADVVMPLAVGEGDSREPAALGSGYDGEVADINQLGQGTAVRGEPDGDLGWGTSFSLDEAFPRILATEPIIGLDAAFGQSRLEKPSRKRLAS